MLWWWVRCPQAARCRHSSCSKTTASQCHLQKTCPYREGGLCACVCPCVCQQVTWGGWLASLHVNGLLVVREFSEAWSANGNQAEEKVEYRRSVRLFKTHQLYRFTISQFRCQPRGVPWKSLDYSLSTIFSSSCLMGCITNSQDCNNHLQMCDSMGVKVFDI